MRLVFLALVITLFGCVGSSTPRNPMKKRECVCPVDSSTAAEVDSSTQEEPKQTDEPTAPYYDLPFLSEPI